MNRLFLGGLLMLSSLALGAADPAFLPDKDGAFKFDTGLLSGSLRPLGKSLGLVSVTHKPSGKMLDRGDYGLCSLYRVFTTSHRYGKAAWDWPSTATLVDGGVHVLWASDPTRPFVLMADYHWVEPAKLRVAITIQAQQDLPGFEVFLASYFNPVFSNAAVAVASSSGTENTFIAPEEKEGVWQMFPRDKDILPLIQDGRWQLPPNPVAWVYRQPFAKPLTVRWTENLAVVFAARPEDCFALSMPYQTERHFSTYLSLFGRDIKAGGKETATVTLEVKPQFDLKNIP